MDSATQHAVALAIVHEEAGRTLSKADFDLCMRIAKRSLTSAETEVPWISVHDQVAPITARGTTMSVIVACKRARDGETYVFAAEYANAFELEPGNDGDTRLVTGWFVTGLDSTGEFDYAYQSACGEGDEITHWMLMPRKPGAHAAPAPTLTDEHFTAAQKTFHSIVVLEMSELCDRASPEGEPDAMVANDREMAGCIERALERTGCVIVPRGLLATRTPIVAPAPAPAAATPAMRLDGNATSSDVTMINGVPVSVLQGAFKKDDLVDLMKVTRLVHLAPLLSDAQYTAFLNALMHYSIKVVGWAEGRVSAAQTGESGGDVVSWRELARRLYVELFHCDQQMRSTRDEDGEPHWTQSTVVRDVLRDAKSALDGGASVLHAGASQSAPEGNHSP